MAQNHIENISCLADTSVVKSLADVSDVFVLSLLNSSPDCIKLIEPDGSLSYMNPNGQCAMEIDDFSDVAGLPWNALWPEESQSKISDSVKAALAGETTRLEAFCPTARGAARWWDISVSPILNGNGDVERILSISRDITPVIEREDRLRQYDLELKALNKSLSEELAVQDTLKREIDHRVKNSLAMVASILRIQAHESDNSLAKIKIKAAADRVTTIARIHETLQTGRNSSAIPLETYLPQLVKDVTSAHARSGITLEMDISPVTISADRAVAIGLITAELVTNAYKHAFVDQHGTVRLTLTQSSDHNLKLVISDNGKGGCQMTGLARADNDTSSSGLGSRIAQLYVQQIGGTLTCDSPIGVGTTFTLDFEP